MSHWLKFFFKAVCILLVLLSAAFGLWVFHAQPMYDGQLRSEGLKASVKAEGRSVALSGTAQVTTTFGAVASDLPVGRFTGSALRPLQTAALETQER